MGLLVDTSPSPITTLDSVASRMLAAAMKVRQLMYSHFTPNQEKHRKAWSYIFKSSKWASKVVAKGLNPVLLGSDLYEIYNDTGEAAYIFLTIVDNGCGTYKEGLLDSLQPHFFDCLTMEVLFDDSNITLNIGKIYNRACSTANHQRLCSSSQGLHSASLHWADSFYKLQTISGDDIVGLELNGSKDVSIICGLIVTDPEDPQVQQVQECFQSLQCPPVKPVFLPGQDEDFCLGWKLA